MWHHMHRWPLFVVQVLRMTSGLVNKLRVHPRQDISEELANDFTNTSLVNLLCLMTRGVHECQQLVEAANSAYKLH
jgi:adenosine deaminase